MTDDREKAEMLEQFYAQARRRKVIDPLIWVGTIVVYALLIAAFSQIIQLVIDKASHWMLP